MQCQGILELDRVAVLNYLDAPFKSTAFDKDMGTVMLVNFVRKQVAAGTTQAAIMAAVDQGTFLQDEVQIHALWPGPNSAPNSTPYS